MTNTEIRELSIKELKDKLIEAKTTLVRLKLNHKVSDIENPMVIRSSRRGIARLKTEISARNNAAK